MGPSLKDLLDAPSEAVAVEQLATAESNDRDLLGGGYEVEVEDTSSPVEGARDEEAMDRLGALNEEERLAVNHFRSVDWLKVVIGVRRNPELAWEDVLRQVGSEILDQLREAEKTQYATVDKPAEVIEAPAKRGRAMEKLARLARFTPLRLVYAERELLRLLESTLYISDYTDSIDILHSGHKHKQIVKQIRQICSILTGLVLARDYEEGQRLIKDRDFSQLASFFQACFEIGRRYKVLNPEKMRDSYGKLMYFLMDSRDISIQRMLEFDCVAPVKTVYDLLARKRNGLDLLKDPLLYTATREIYDEGHNRYVVQSALQEKEEAAKTLIARYATHKRSNKSQARGFFRFALFSAQADEEESDRLGVPRSGDWDSQDLTEEDVELAIYSMKDHMTFLRFSERPVDQMLHYLESYFPADKPEDPRFSLAIMAGQGGARLSHQHGRQYHFVKQSLLLWREVLRNFMRLWCMADSDMLASDNRYKLKETGQGLNRLQHAPSVYKTLSEILHTVQDEAGGWVGSSAIHLGDHNVPNALMFIDKYTQIPRFVNPVVQALENIPKICRSDPAIATMIENGYGSAEILIKTILCDFFRHAFDGSGADNFFDAGSCIDGRLTSAWNWCNQIEKKRYYPIFLLCGFTGFDGKF